jgi:hypothetical protein
MNERGIAMPAALIALLILSALMIAFALLAGTEPVIAENQLKTARARTFAEAGVELAIWGLTNPTAANGTTANAALYQGATFVSVNALGGFTVNVTNGATANERAVDAVGWTPTNDVDDTRSKGVRRIQAILTRLRPLDPPCALCVKGNLDLSGAATVDARGGACPGGPAPQGGTITTGNTTQGGNSKIWGPGNNVYNEATDKPSGVPGSTFDSFTFTSDEIAVLKSLAKAQGTYYKGSVTFNSSNPMPDGLVFVDTTDGSEYTQRTPDSARGDAQINGSVDFNGWLIVAGSIQISGNVTMTGLVYAQNDIVYNGTGTGSISGAVISENRKDAVSTAVDASASGNADIVYDCQAVRDGGGALSQGWLMKPGSDREVEGR